MLDVATREAFQRWLERHHEDLLDQISQRPRSIKGWATDYAKAMRSAVAELGEDPGHGGIFSDAEEAMGLLDPESDDDEELW